jgi:hypothetical protein
LEGTIRARFFRPNFRFSVLKPEGELCPLTDNAGKHFNDGRFYHLHVLNERTWVQATHCQLRMTRIEIPGPDGQPQIKWDGDIPIRRRHQENYPMEAVIGSAIDYDLCVILKDTNENPPLLLLEPIIGANNLQIRWPGITHFTASFQLKCAEGDSETVKIQFDWDGSWQQGDAEIQRHFKLTKLPSPAA